MEMSVGEFIDKYSIMKIRVGKRIIGSDEIKPFDKEYNELRTKYRKIPWEALLDQVYNINNIIWGYENPIHEGQLSSEIMMAGVLSLRVREFNCLRLNMGKIITKLVKGYKI